VPVSFSFGGITKCDPVKNAQSATKANSTFAPAESRQIVRLDIYDADSAPSRQKPFFPEKEFGQETGCCRYNTSCPDSSSPLVITCDNWSMRPHPHEHR
jgi:hypothetical protein